MKHPFSFVWFVQIIILLIVYFSHGLTCSESNLRILLIMVSINTILFFVYKNNVRKSKKSGIWSLIFLVGYLIVFFQYYVDLLIGNLDKNERVFANSNIIMSCFVISLCGLLAFFCGYTFSTFKNKKVQQEKIEKIPNTKLLKFLLFISLVLFVVYNYKMILLGGYSQEMLEAQAGTMGLYSNMLFQIFLFLYISYKSITFKYVGSSNFKTYVKHIGIVVNFCTILYIIFILVSGDRGPVIVICLAYWGGYLLSSKNDISYVRLIALLSIAAFIITLLGDMRKLDNNMAYWDKIKRSIDTTSTNDASFSPYTEELAGSVKTLHYAVDYVPEKHPYLYGSFQFRQLCSAIPFMNRFVYNITDPHFRYKGSAFFVTWIIQGDNYTYGSGTSCNADLYLSFGIWGVIIGFLLWGGVYRRIEDNVDTMMMGNVASIVILYFLAYSLYVNRASMLCFFNFMLFTLIAKYIYERIVTKRTCS